MPDEPEVYMIQARSSGPGAVCSVRFSLPAFLRSSYAITRMLGNSDASVSSSVWSGFESLFNTTYCIVGASFSALLSVGKSPESRNTALDLVCLSES